MSATQYTPSGIAYDRAGPRGALPLVLIHAGVADRRMWDPLWSGLTASHNALRLDLRGFGSSVAPPPDGRLAPVTDVVETVRAAGIDRCHLVGASFGAGVAVEVALVEPDLVQSLLLVAPGGSLFAEATPELRAFFDAERSALSAGDLDAAVEANLAWWVDGPTRAPGAVDEGVREAVARMQRCAFEVTNGWPVVQDHELDPPVLDRLGEVQAPTLVLVGGLDVDAVAQAAQRVTSGIVGAQRIDLPETAHLPSMEMPAQFLALLHAWATAPLHCTRAEAGPH